MRGEKIEEKEVESKHTNTHKHIYCYTHMTTHTFKDGGELTAGGGRSLSLDASGYFRRLFQVRCLLSLRLLAPYIHLTAAEGGRGSIFITLRLNSTVCVLVFFFFLSDVPLFTVYQFL